MRRKLHTDTQSLVSIDHSLLEETSQPEGILRRSGVLQGVVLELRETVCLAPTDAVISKPKSQRALRVNRDSQGMHSLTKRV